MSIPQFLCVKENFLVEHTYTIQHLSDENCEEDASSTQFRKQQIRVSCWGRPGTLFPARSLDFTLSPDNNLIQDAVAEVQSTAGNEPRTWLTPYT